MRRVVLINQDYFAVGFPYNPSIIQRLKKLSNRKWNPEKKHWEIHLAHLSDVMVILRINKTMIPPEVQQAFSERWQGIDAILSIRNDYTQLSGANLPTDALDEATSYWKLGAEHTNKYKQGQWDGMRHLLNRKYAQFPSGLLSRVVEVLDNHQIRYRLEDLRIEPQEHIEIKTPPLSKLRDYQKQALRSAMGEKRGILEMATGSGKTILAAHILGHLKHPAVFFVHTKDLLYQSREMLTQVLNIPIGQFGDGIVDPKPVTVGTVQTCSKAMGVSGSDRSDALEENESSADELPVDENASSQIREFLGSVCVAFFDECHHVPADTFYALTMNLPNAFYRFGLSATPYRADRQDMLIEAAIGKKLTRINASYLIEKRVLVPPHITFFTIPPCQRSARRTYHEVYQTEIVENQTRNHLIAETVMKLNSQDRTVLVLVSQIKHGEILSSLLPNATFLTGKDPSGLRNAALAGLRERQIPTIIATTLADEGLDLPSLDALVLAGGGKSETRALQRIGRALRKVKGKSIAIVVDFFDQGPFLSEHSTKRLEIYETEERFQIELINPWTQERIERDQISTNAPLKLGKTGASPKRKPKRAKRPTKNP